MLAYALHGHARIRAQKDNALTRAKEIKSVSNQFGSKERGQKRILNSRLSDFIF